MRSKLIAAAAQGTEEDELLEEENFDDLFEDTEDEMIEHSYVLREGMTVSFELPANLTSNEAYRLSQFIGSLSFDESSSI